MASSARISVREPRKPPSPKAGPKRDGRRSRACSWVRFSSAWLVLVERLYRGRSGDLDGPVGFAFSPNAGNLVLPAGFCGPVQTGLGGPVFVIGIVLADGAGVATLLPGNGIPAAGCGGYMQAVDFGTCAVTPAIIL